ncbi:hypothetical protein FKW77_000870 [Venturia effusa]|uniref:Uncharacterized protein n=1 Tax=Venturia effusa TaxID=50376 RepID=A0A517LPF3_9PEZI|nr:hypothetical protein FKW77_000870 [Venturia effusa]
MAAGLRSTTPASLIKTNSCFFTPNTKRTEWKTFTTRLIRHQIGPATSKSTTLRGSHGNRSSVDVALDKSERRRTMNHVPVGAGRIDWKRLRQNSLAIKQITADHSVRNCAVNKGHAQNSEIAFYQKIAPISQLRPLCEMNVQPRRGKFQALSEYESEDDARNGSSTRLKSGGSQLKPLDEECAGLTGREV